MKKIITILLIALISGVCYAQRIKIHQGNNVNSFLISNVDSIVHDKNEFVRVYYDNQLSEFPINEVDSFSINSEQIECYNIVEEQLNGWDDGVFTISDHKEDFYIVSKKELYNEVERIVICINSFSNEDTDNAIFFLFDIKGNLQEIVISEYQFKAQKYLEDFIFVVYKNGMYLGNFNVPCEVINTNSDTADRRSINKIRRSPFFNNKGEISLPKIKDFAEKAGGVLNSAGEVIDVAIKLDEGKYGDILMDFVVGGLISIAELPLAWQILAVNGVKDLLKWLYEQDKIRFLGNAEIEITSIKRTSKTAITVKGMISNISSIPTTYIVRSDYPNPKYNYKPLADIPNTVYWGIAEGKGGQPGFYLNDNSTGIIPISNGQFSYTFYMDEEPGEVHYFRPFLVPEVKLQSEDALLPNPYTCIRYGERKEFMDMDIELSNFKQIKCSKGNGEYIVQFEIDGSIPGVFQELSGWGIDVGTKSEPHQQRYYAKESSDDYYPPKEKVFTCEVKMKENEIADYGIERIAEIVITPYITFWNSSTFISYFDSQDYTVRIYGLEFKELKQSEQTYTVDNYSVSMKAIHTDDIVSLSMKAIIDDSSDQVNVDLSSYESYGIYIKDKMTGDEYYNSVQENGNSEFNIVLNIPRNEFECDYSSLTAKCDRFLFATYTIDKENCINYYDERNPQLIYDEKPNITIINASVTGIEKGYDAYGRPCYYTMCEWKIAVTGTLWFDNIQLYTYSDGGWSSWSTQSVSADGIYTVNARRTYYPNSDIYSTSFYQMYLHDGSVKASTNSLVLSGTPENPLLTIGGTPSYAPTRNTIKTNAPLENNSAVFLFENMERNN